MSLPEDDEIAERWRSYLNATVVVEIDDALVALTGPDAVSQWPFQGVVHALTAWDPAGASFERDENERNNDSLYATLSGSGATIFPSAGYDSSIGSARHASDPGEVEEPSRFRRASRFGRFVDEGFVVAGLTEAEVIGIAVEFDQEAVYRITADELAVISTRGSVSESTGRL